MSPTRLSLLLICFVTLTRGREVPEGRPQHSLQAQSLPENGRKVIQRLTQLLMILLGAQIHIMPILYIYISFDSQQ